MSDLIERQKAKDYIESQKGRPFIGCTILDAMKIMLDEVPSAEPERKTGEWLHKPDEYNDDTYECSRCGEPWTLIDGTPEENNMKFCPNCGADMRGDHE